MLVKSESIKAISAALVKAQKQMSNAVKDSKNPFFKSMYADLNSVREAVLPALNDNDISVLQLTLTENGRNFVRTTLLHSSGEYICSDTEILTTKANDPQNLGSSISYARRYGLQAFLCVGAVDDDAETAMSRTSPEHTKPAQKATPVPTPAPVTEAKTEPLKAKVTFSKKVLNQPKVEEDEI